MRTPTKHGDFEKAALSVLTVLQQLQEQYGEGIRTGSGKRAVMSEGFTALQLIDGVEDHSQNMGRGGKVPHRCSAEYTQHATEQLKANNAIEPATQTHNPRYRINDKGLAILAKLQEGLPLEVALQQDDVKAKEPPSSSQPMRITNSQAAELGRKVLAKLGHEPRIQKLLQEIGINADKNRGKT